MLSFNVAAGVLNTVLSPAPAPSRDGAECPADFGQELQRATQAGPSPAPSPRPEQAAAKGDKAAPADEPAGEPASESAADPAEAKPAAARPPAARRPGAGSTEGRDARAQRAAAAKERGGALPEGDAAAPIEGTSATAADDAGTDVAGAGTGSMAAGLAPQAAPAGQALTQLPSAGLTTASRDIADLDAAGAVPAGESAVEGMRLDGPGARFDRLASGEARARGQANEPKTFDPASFDASAVASAARGSGLEESRAAQALEAGALEVGGQQGPATASAAGDLPAWAAALADARGESRATAASETRSGSHGGLHTETVHAAIGSDEFAPALGARLAFLARDGIEHARLNVHPAELGPIAVRLALDGNQVRVEMSAEVQATRQALEQSLPSLASALRDSGFTLAGGGVFQQPPQDRGGQGTGQSSDASEPEAGTGAAAASGAVAQRVVQGLVDVFA